MINFRLLNSEIGRRVRLDMVTVARKKKKMLPSLYVHCSLYAEGFDNYSMLLFVLENIPDLSATSYPPKGSEETYLCFASTRRPHMLAPKMKKIMNNGLLRFIHLSSRWTLILEDYTKGKIEERFFYMFPLRPK